jgi:glucose-1-phosphate adenylyltransferase
MKVLKEDAADPNSEKDFGKNVLPRMVAEGYRVFAFPYGEYWVDVGTIQSYWEAHMDLLQDVPPIDLLDREWIIHTRSEERPPVNLRTGAMVNHSLITDGCTIEGSVEYSVLSPGVKVARGAVVKQSIIMGDATIEAGAVVDKCILDKNVVVGRFAHLGYGTDFTSNLELGLNTGISVIGKGTRIPPDFKIGRNVVVGSDLSTESFAEDIKSGQLFNVDVTD